MNDGSRSPFRCQICVQILVGSLMWPLFSLVGPARAAPPARGDCAAEVGGEQIAALAEKTLGTFAYPSAAASTEFLLAREDLWAALPCVSEPLSPSLAAAVHLIEGLHAWLRANPGETLRRFQAAYAANIPVRLPETLSVPGSDLAELEVRAMGSPAPEREPVEVEPGVQLVVDGRLTQALPSGLPSIVQGLLVEEGEQEGRAAWTVYHSPGEPLPTLNLSAPPDPARARRRVAVLGLSGGALATGLTAGLLYRAALGRKHAALDGATAPYSKEEVESLAQAERMMTGSGWAGGLAVGLGGTSALLLFAF